MHTSICQINKAAYGLFEKLTYSSTSWGYWVNAFLCRFKLLHISSVTQKAPYAGYIVIRFVQSLSVCVCVFVCVRVCVCERDNSAGLPLNKSALKCDQKPNQLLRLMSWLKMDIKAMIKISGGIFELLKVEERTIFPSSIISSSQPGDPVKLIRSFAPYF